MKWIIAGIVAYIAFMQFKTNRDRLRLELYKKRFSVYEGLKELLNKIIICFDVTDDDLREFRIKTNEAAFLFDKDIVEYLKEINNKGTKLYSHNCKLKSPDLPNPNGYEEEEIKKISIWLQDQLEESKDIFSKYLKFKTNIKSFW